MINCIQSSRFCPTFNSKVIIDNKTMRKISESNKLLGNPLSEQLYTISTNTEKDVVFINMLKDKVRMEVCKLVDGKSLQGISSLQLSKKIVGFNLVEMYNKAIANFKDLSDICTFDMSQYF